MAQVVTYLLSSEQQKKLGEKTWNFVTGAHVSHMAVFACLAQELK